MTTHEITVATTAYQDPHSLQARPSLIAAVRDAELASFAPVPTSKSAGCHCFCGEQVTRTFSLANPVISWRQSMYGGSKFRKQSIVPRVTCIHRVIRTFICIHETFRA